VSYDIPSDVFSLVPRALAGVQGRRLTPRLNGTSMEAMDNALSSHFGSVIHCPGLFSRNARFCFALILTVPEAGED